MKNMTRKPYPYYRKYVASIYKGCFKVIVYNYVKRKDIDYYGNNK